MRFRDSFCLSLLFLELRRLEPEGGGIFASDANGLLVKAAVAGTASLNLERELDVGTVLRGEMLNDVLDDLGEAGDGVTRVNVGGAVKAAQGRVRGGQGGRAARARGPAFAKPDGLINVRRWSIGRVGRYLNGLGQGLRGYLRMD